MASLTLPARAKPLDTFEDLIKREEMVVTYQKGSVIEEYSKHSEVMKTLYQRGQEQGEITYKTPGPGLGLVDGVLMDERKVTFYDVDHFKYVIKAAFTDTKTGNTDLKLSKEGILRSSFGYPLAKKSPMKEEVDKWKVIPLKLSYFSTQSGPELALPRKLEKLYL